MIPECYKMYIKVRYTVPYDTQPNLIASFAMIEMVLFFFVFLFRKCVCSSLFFLCKIRLMDWFKLFFHFHSFLFAKNNEITIKKNSSAESIGNLIDTEIECSVHFFDFVSLKHCVVFMKISSIFDLNRFSFV